MMRLRIQGMTCLPACVSATGPMTCATAQTLGASPVRHLHGSGSGRCTKCAHLTDVLVPVLVMLSKNGRASYLTCPPFASQPTERSYAMATRYVESIDPTSMRSTVARTECPPCCTRRSSRPSRDCPATVTRGRLRGTTHALPPRAVACRMSRNVGRVARPVASCRRRTPNIQPSPPQPSHPPGGGGGRCHRLPLLRGVRSSPRAV
jgi:hypothetical protein